MSTSVNDQVVPIQKIVELSNLLGQMGAIDRATLIPSGRQETDSHHSFSLALLAYDICTKYCPELDTGKIILYALVHDLPEIITGDEDTLHLDEQALADKQAKDALALEELHEKMADYPAILAALAEYERLDTPEAATVYVLDKACTTWTHYADSAASLRKRGVSTGEQARLWRERQLTKINGRLNAQPPSVILDILHESTEHLSSMHLD